MRPVSPEVLIFAGAGAVSLLAFTALILIPAVGSFGRTWEKATAALLSLIILIALVGVGVAVGVLVVYNWEDISGLFP